MPAHTVTDTVGSADGQERFESGSTGKLLGTLAEWLASELTARRDQAAKTLLMASQRISNTMFDGGTGEMGETTGAMGEALHPSRTIGGPSTIAAAPLTVQLVAAALSFGCVLVVFGACCCCLHCCWACCCRRRVASPGSDHGGHAYVQPVQCQLPYRIAACDRDGITDDHQQECPEWGASTACWPARAPHTGGCDGLLARRAAHAARAIHASPLRALRREAHRTSSHYELVRAPIHQRSSASVARSVAPCSALPHQMVPGCWGRPLFPRA